MRISRWLGGRWSRALVAGLFATGAITFFGPSPGGAINRNNTTFELDGNATTDHPGTGAPDDWDRVCAQVHADTTGATCFRGETSPTVATTNGATSVAFTSQPANNGTTFTGGGSKDPSDVSSWAWNQGSGGLPGKDILLDGFAARYNETSNCAGEASCNVINFGMDRFDNSGDAQNGFWFFQNSITLGAGKSGAGETFNGVHKNGDLLVVSDFSIGGTTSTISAYKWNSSCTGTDHPLAVGGCADANLTLLGTSTSANCALAADNASFCGIVNGANGADAPWSFTDKAGNSSYAQGEFYEGAIDLTKFGLGAECFASTAAESRSSTSTSAVLKSFVLGAFGACGSLTKTTPEDSSGNGISNGSIAIGTGASSPAGTSLAPPQVEDKAVVTVTGTSTWSGTIAFSLCGPDDLGGTTGNPTNECLAGGTAVGSAQAVGTSPPLAHAVSTVTSSLTTVTKVGAYCWRATFTPDADSLAAGVPGGSDASTTECFSVTAVTPTLTTTASGATTLGHNISDSAVLAGTADEPASPVINTTGAHGSPAAGTISFTVYGPDSCSNVATTLGPVSVTGDNTYGSGNFKPTAVGAYVFVASYTGDSPNTNASAAVTCANEPTAEAVTVTDTTSVTSAQTWLPNDSATVTSAGGSPLTGSVTLTLYDNGTCTPGTPNPVTGTPANQLYTKTVTFTGATSPQIVPTTNTLVTVAASNTVSWQVTYTSTASNVSSSTTNCSEQTILTIAN